MSYATRWYKPKLFLVATVLAFCTALGLHGSAHVTAQAPPSREASHAAFEVAAKSAENGTVSFNGKNYPTYDHGKLAQIPGVRTGPLGKHGQPVTATDLNHVTRLAYPTPLKGSVQESLDQTGFGYGVNSSYLYGWWFQQYPGGPYVLEEIYGHGDSYIASGDGNIYGWDYLFSDRIGTAGSQGTGHGYRYSFISVHAVENSYTLPALPGVCYWSRATSQIIFTSGNTAYPYANNSFTYCDI